MRIKQKGLLLGILIIGLIACKNKPAPKTRVVPVYKGLYSYGPEIKSFKECDNGREFWVTDSSAELELKYSQLNFGKPDEPVYIEVQGRKVKSEKNGLGSDYDSVLIVKKLIKLTKDLPKTGCN
ncbi:MAG: hypothetical protein ACXVAY_22820 [Mucilaginibacter sp.]